MYPPIKLLTFLRKEYYVRLAIAFLLMTLSGIADLLSLATVVTFLEILTNPSEAINSSIPTLIPFSSAINNENSLRLYITILFCTTILISGLLRIFTIKFNTYQIAMVSAYLSKKTFNSAISIPYSLHKEISSSHILSVISIKMPRVNRALVCFLQLINASILILSLIIGLLLITKWITVTAILFFISIYLLIGLKTKNILKRFSQMYSIMLNKEAQIIQESYKSAREILLNSNQIFYTNYFYKNELSLQKMNAQTDFYGTFPRFALEPLGIIFIAIAGYFLIVITGNSSDKSIAILGAFALGSQRLLPALQQIYTSWALINARSKEILDVVEVLEYPKEKLFPKTKKINLDKITCDNIYFSYKSQDVLNGINLEINNGEFIGINGKTGGGKSTLMDIILGLTKPTKGNLFINKENIYEKNKSEFLAKWRGSVSNVPQNIFLIDASFAENIALGVPLEKINYAKVVKAAKIACIDDFINSKENAYKEYIGENGIKLSGGQKQRIGIARAFYNDPKYLILDESTSALDEITETKVFDNIKEYSGGNLTIIIISHKASTLSYCDKVYSLVNGKLNELNTYK